MKKVFVCLVGMALFFSSCTDYGKKVVINDKSEVYYKGDGVTEANAKDLGNLLLEMSFFNTTEDKSVQISKDSGTYFVRFVVDEKAFEQKKDEASSSFRLIQSLIAERIFSGNPTKVILTDNKFKDIARMGEATSEEKEMLQLLNTPDSAAAQSEADTSATAAPVATEGQ